MISQRDVASKSNTSRPSASCGNVVFCNLVFCNSRTRSKGPQRAKSVKGHVKAPLSFKILLMRHQPPPRKSKTKSQPKANALYSCRCHVSDLKTGSTSGPAFLSEGEKAGETASASAVCERDGLKKIKKVSRNSLSVLHLLLFWSQSTC